MKFSKTLIIALLLYSCQPNKIITTDEIPETGSIGRSAMVTSAHPLATKVGVEILKKGGNAFDAAVAVQFALAVVYPEAGNIGGGGFAVFRNSDGQLGTLDFREKAPAAAKKDMYLDSKGEVNTSQSRLGHLAAGVPGSVAGMWALHQKMGTLPWRELIKPAIQLAYKGYILTENASENLNRAQNNFVEGNRYTPWVVKENGWSKGDSVVQLKLASTLTFIQNKGKEGFYKGIVADQIAKEMILGRGLITKEDLESYEVKWRAPIVGSYKGIKIISMPPPSSGGIAILQLLQGAEKYDFPKMGYNSVDAIHIMTELERRVYADRATYLGDPDFYNVPVEMLLNKEYNTDRFASIKNKQKTPSKEIKEGEVDVIESVQTTHFSIVDKQRNAIAITTTLNGYYGCKVMVQGAGFFLNNEMDDFSAKPGVPNMFGLVGAEANAIAPGKRMLSSMTPTILEKNDQLFMVLGSPGGSTIITSVFQTILNVIDHGMTMQEAVNASRIHSQWLPDVILVEEEALDSTRWKALENIGHELQFLPSRPKWGNVDAILVRGDSILEGASDYTRGDDFAEGY